MASLVYTQMISRHNDNHRTVVYDLLAAHVLATFNIHDASSMNYRHGLPQRGGRLAQCWSEQHQLPPSCQASWSCLGSLSRHKLDRGRCRVALGPIMVQPAPKSRSSTWMLELSESTWYPPSLCCCAQLFLSALCYGGFCRSFQVIGCFGCPQL